MDEPSLRSTIAVLRRRRRIIVLCVLVATLVALGLSLVQTPEYRAESELLLKRTASEDLLVDQIGQTRSGADATRELNNEIRLIESRAVRDAVDEAYDGPLDVRDVSASAPASDSNDVIELGVTSPDAKAGSELVNLYARTYIDVRRERQVEDLLSASEEIQTRLDDVNSRIAELSGPLNDVNAQITASTPGSATRSQLEDQRNQILAQILPQLAPLYGRAGSFQSQLQQLQVTEDLTRSGGVTLLSPAEEPQAPVSPRTVRNVVAGALIGLLGGIALALLVNHLDDSVSAKEDVEAVTGLPTLGLIPKVADMAGPGDLMTVHDPSSSVAEAYRLLRTSVKFMALDGTVKTILVTSPAASEGKTVTAANLAVVLAQGGDRVLLVGADLRRPRAHELFGAPQAPGLTTVVLSEATAESATYAIKEAPGLHLLASGPTPPNPAELLDSVRTHELVATAAARYDIVVIDSPPVLPVADAQVLARQADAVLLVVAHGETSRRGLARAVEMLAQVEAPTVGTVVNLVPAREGYGGEPYRYETYRSRSERRRRREEPATAPAVPGAHLAGNGERTAVPARPRVEPDAATDEPH
jgi:non-specific protein-tyrosine kinase